MIETTKGRVAIMFVGAVQVDSIQFEPQIEVGYTLGRGEDMGGYHFGGSTMVLFFDHDLTIDQDLVRTSAEGEERQVVAGERVGEF